MLRKKVMTEINGSEKLTDVKLACQPHGTHTKKKVGQPDSISQEGMRPSLTVDTEVILRLAVSV